jgi:hypothetical protein
VTRPRLDPGDVLLDPIEASRLLGLKVGTRKGTTKNSTLRPRATYLARLRSEGGGPPYLRLGPRRIAYSRSTLLRWAGEHERTSTSE